jgi:hypothetical protein
MLPGIRPEFGGYPDYVTVSELANVWQVTTRRINQFVEAGIIPRQAHGQYHLLKCSVAYIQNREKTRDLPAEDANPGELNPRDRLNLVQAVRNELKLARERGELIPLATYKQALFQDMNTLRERLLLLPALAGELAGETSEVIRNRLDAAVRDVLTSLSHGNGQPGHAGVDGGPDGDQAAGLPLVSAPLEPQRQ